MGNNPASNSSSKPRSVSPHTWAVGRGEVVVAVRIDHVDAAVSEAPGAKRHALVTQLEDGVGAGGNLHGLGHANGRPESVISSAGRRTGIHPTITIRGDTMNTNPVNENGSAPRYVSPHT